MDLKLFLQSTDPNEILGSFTSILSSSKIKKSDPKFYTQTKRLLSSKSKRIKDLYQTLDEKYNATERRKDQLPVFIVGSNEIAGLRMAIEAALLGCQVTCVNSSSSKQKSNNRYHLSSWCVDELTSLGAARNDLLGKDFFQIETNQIHVVLLRACLLLGVDVDFDCTYLHSTKKSNEIYSATIKPKKSTINCDYKVLIDASSIDSKTSPFKECKFDALKGEPIIAVTCIAAVAATTTTSIMSTSEFSWNRLTNPKLFTTLDTQGYNGLQHIRYLQNAASHHIYMKMNTKLNESEVSDILTFFGLQSNTCSLKYEITYTTTAPFRSMQAMKTMGKSTNGTEDGCLVLLCGNALSSTSIESENYLLVDWLSILDNGAILTAIATLNDNNHIQSLIEYRQLLWSYQQKIITHPNQMGHLLLLGSDMQNSNGGTGSNSSTGGNLNSRNIALKRSTPKTRYVNFNSEIFTSSSSNTPDCITTGSSKLRWYPLNKSHLTSEKRHYYDNLLYNGGIIYIKATSKGKLYISEDTVLFSSTATQQIKHSIHWKKYIDLKQVIGRNNHAKWNAICQTMKNNMITQYQKQVLRVKEIHSQATVIAVIRCLDALETPLDPPRFGDAIISFPNNTNGRKRQEHELKLTRKETTDQIMQLFATSGNAETSSSIREYPVLKGYHKKFRHDDDDEILNGYDTLWRTLFDRAIVTTVSADVYETRKKEEQLFLEKRRLQGEKYRKQAKELKDNKKSGKSNYSSGSGGMMNELKDMQDKRKSGKWGSNTTKNKRRSTSSTDITHGGKTSTIQEDQEGDEGDEGDESDKNQNEKIHDDENENEEKLSTSVSLAKKKKTVKPIWKPIHSGWLFKKGSRFNSNLRHRLFVLQKLVGGVDKNGRSTSIQDLAKMKLSYYENEKKYASKAASGSILIKHITRIATDLNTTTRAIEKYGLYITTCSTVLSSSRIYVLYCESTRVRDEWEYVLRKTIRGVSKALHNAAKENMNENEKLYSMCMTSLAHTYTLPGSTLNNVRLIERVDKSQLNELKEQSTNATLFFEETAGVTGDLSSDENNDQKEEDDEEEEETETKIETTSTGTVQQQQQYIPTLKALRDVSGNIIRDTTKLCSNLLELNLMVKQIETNTETTISQRLEILKKDLNKISTLHETLQKQAVQHSTTMKKLRDEAKVLFWTPFGEMKKPNFKKMGKCDVARHEGCIKTANRFFEIKNTTLYYYKYNPKDTTRKRAPKPRGSIDLRDVCSVRASRASMSPPFSLELVTEHKNYILTCQNRKDYIRWAYKLQDSVNQTKD